MQPVTLAVRSTHTARSADSEFELLLWGKVVKDDNKHRCSLVDKVVWTALPGFINSEVVACSVKAFMTANLLNELIELLEKIVLRHDFAQYKNFQNLLILTAVQVAGAGGLSDEHKDRVIQHINRLDKFDGADIALTCVSEGLCKEALVIYKKHDDKMAATTVLLENILDLERAKDFATANHIKEIWSTLAAAQLQQVQNSQESTR